MAIEIIDRKPHARGAIYKIKASDKTIDILYLFHAMERIEKWGITEEMVAKALILPEEVIIGHGDRNIAHRRHGDHLIRAVYEYQGEMPVLVTVYFPYTNRYFKGGGMYEDKILD